MDTEELAGNGDVSFFVDAVQRIAEMEGVNLENLGGLNSESTRNITEILSRVADLYEKQKQKESLLITIFLVLFIVIILCCLSLCSV